MSHSVYNFVLQNPSATELDLKGLSAEEKERILEVVQRSRETTQAMEGQLSKFTNLMKGWQYRWFVLNPESGDLIYYLDKEKTRCRGNLPLAAAVVSPSEEDSVSFMISACNSDIYRLRAQDAKERQHWINLIRAVAEYHGKNQTKPIRPPPPSLKSSHLERSASISPSSGGIKETSLHRTKTIGYKGENYQRTKPTMPANPIQEELKNIKDALNSVMEYHSSAIEALECRSSSTEVPSTLDEHTLVLKATSQATVNILQQCFSILQQQAFELQGSANSARLPAGATIGWFEPLSQRRIERSMSTESDESIEMIEPRQNVMSIKEYAENEIEDQQLDTDEQLEDMESHKSVILHLLSQLKLGMDLTRVVLPTFVLEKRSLLEMYADFMAHGDLFLKIPHENSPEDRMIAVLEFYLTSFHVGRKSGVAKKPYNPILGEHFHCSFDGQFSDSGNDMIHFLAEQVSHHPPISAFYAESPAHGISMNTHIWTKSKFYGMSIGVINVGECVLTLHDHSEEYIITFPNAYCRSILTVPWVELGGRTFIRCPQTGYNAVITFHTKPFYGGKANRVTCEVKHSSTEDGKVICRGEGYWDGIMELDFEKSDEKKILDISKLKICKKHVRPLDMQSEYESRKLWYNVTDALQNDNLEKATEEKHKLEERQRNEAKHRSASGLEWNTNFFYKHTDEWLIYPQIPQLNTRKKSKSIVN